MKVSSNDDLSKPTQRINGTGMCLGLKLDAMELEGMLHLSTVQALAAKVVFKIAVNHSSGVLTKWGILPGTSS